MSLISMSVSKKKQALSLMIWCFTLLGIGTGNLANPNLWFDESLQVWASRGQDQYPEYDSPVANTPASALHANYTNSWDPPGFTLSLHFLGKITGQLWIFRSWTLLLFALSCLTLTMITRKWAPQYLLSSIAGLSLMLSPLLTHYAFEIRPYMFELLHTALAVFLVCCCEVTWSKKKCFVFGIALGFTMASRYPSIFPAILCVTFIACKFFYQPNNPNLFELDKPKLSRYLCLFIPSFLIGLTIVALVVSRQWQQATSQNAYHLMFLICSKPSEVFNWLTLILWLPMLALLALRLLPIRVFPELARKYDLYIAFVLSLNVLRLLVDWGRFIPYSLLFRFNLPCHALLLFSWMPLLLMLLEYFALQQQRQAWLNRLPSVITLILTCAIITQAFGFTREDPDPSIGYLRRLPVNPPPKILSAINIYPSLRYACEFGVLKDRPHWQEHVYFYGSQYPKDQSSVIQKRFEFIASGGEMKETYYQLAQYKHFNLILESRNYLQGGRSKRPGFSTVIIKLD